MTANELHASEETNKQNQVWAEDRGMIRFYFERINRGCMVAQSGHKSIKVKCKEKT
jgi:hypothetical protein